MIREPGWTAGAQETVLHPIAWALEAIASQGPSSGDEISYGWRKKETQLDTLLKARTYYFPLGDAQALRGREPAGNALDQSRFESA